MKRRLAIIALVVVGVGAVVVWWHRGGAHAARTAEVARPHAAAQRSDPRSLPRAAIAGTVTAEAGAPIAHARVCLELWSSELPRELTRDPRCVDTDERGRFRADDLYAATYTIDAGAHGFLPATYLPTGDRHVTSFELAAGEQKTVAIVLHDGGVELTGSVSDLTGGPIAHARVHAGKRRGSSVETDDRGAFAVWVEPGTIDVSASADGYAPHRESARAPGRIDLVLTPESSLSGTVVDAATRAPIEGARVELGDLELSLRDTSYRTDATGAFHVTRLLPGRYVITAHGEHGYGRSEGSILVGLGQHTGGIVIALHPALQITGKVVVAGARAPCTDARVSFEDIAHARSVVAHTEADGSVRADGVLPGSYEPRIWCRGFQARASYPTIAVVDRDVVGTTWEVVSGASVHGIVKTRTGAPVAGASVSAHTVGGNVRDRTRYAHDDAGGDGAYELAGLAPGTYNVDVTSDRGIGPRDGWTIEIAVGANVEKDLVLDAGGAIKGTVTDGSGAPVADVRVSARAQELMRNSAGVTTDAAGAFAFDAVPPGDYRVVASRGREELRAPGATDDSARGKHVMVTAGQTAAVALVVEAQTQAIKGSVVDADGAPVADAFIAIARESDAAGAGRASVADTRGWWGDGDKPVLTSVDGTFVVGHLSKGSYTLRAYRKGGGEAVAEHVATGTTAKLQIKRTGSIAGTVRRDGGAAPEQIVVRLEDPKAGFTRRETFFMTGGRFAIDELPAGHFVVTAEADGGTKKLELELADNEHKTGVDIVLDVLVVLTGRMVDLISKAPVAGIVLSAELSRGSTFSFDVDDSEPERISDANGRFTLRRVPRGQIAIQGMGRELESSPYSIFHTVRAVTGTGTIELGDLGVVKKRVKPGDPVGELGIHFVEAAPDTPPEQFQWKVSWIDPAGPAAKTELVVGDVVATIDGIAIGGDAAMTGYTLTQAPPGTKLALGLARGVTVPIVLAAP